MQAQTILRTAITQRTWELETYVRLMRGSISFAFWLSFLALRSSFFVSRFIYTYLSLNGCAPSEETH